MRFADRDAAGPHQAVAVDDPVGIVAIAAVADRAAIGHDRCEPRPQGLGHAGIGGDRHQRIGDAVGDVAEIDVPGKDDAAGAHPPVGGRDALAHAGGIDREHRRVFEDVDAGALRRAGEGEGVGQRIDLERVGMIDGAEIMVGAQHVADLFERPRLDLDPEVLRQQPRPGKRGFAIVGLGDVEPAIALHDPAHADLGNGIAHVADAGFRERPQRPGRGQADPLHDLFDIGRIARHHQPAVAPRRIPGDAPGFEDGRRPPAPHDFPRHGQAGQAAADDADVDVDLEPERRPRRRQGRHTRIPGRSEFGLIGAFHLIQPRTPFWSSLHRLAGGRRHQRPGGRGRRPPRRPTQARPTTPPRPGQARMLERSRNHAMLHQSL